MVMYTIHLRQSYPNFWSGLFLFSVRKFICGDCQFWRDVLNVKSYDFAFETLNPGLPLVPKWWKWNFGTSWRGFLLNFNAASYVGAQSYSMLHEQIAEDIMPIYISQPHCDFSIARGCIFNYHYIGALSKSESSCGILQKCWLLFRDVVQLYIHCIPDRIITRFTIAL